PVGGGDDGHPLIADQPAEQAAHDHRIGAVVHHHLVESEAANVPGNGRSDGGDRIAAFGLARFAEPLVNFQHEGVKVDAALGGKGERLMEQVHQHRLAASDAAPEINAAGAPRLAKTGKEAGGRDRKSTRLNSSHVKISYAVFCLKKKKNNQD